MCVVPWRFHVATAAAYWGSVVVIVVVKVLYLFMVFLLIGWKIVKLVNTYIESNQSIVCIGSLVSRHSCWSWTVMDAGRSRTGRTIMSQDNQLLYIVSILPKSAHWVLWAPSCSMSFWFRRWMLYSYSCHVADFTATTMIANIIGELLMQLTTTTTRNTEKNNEKCVNNCEY